MLKILGQSTDTTPHKNSHINGVHVSGVHNPCQYLWHFDRITDRHKRTHLIGPGETGEQLC